MQNFRLAVVLEFHFRCFFFFGGPGGVFVNSLVVI